MPSGPKKRKAAKKKHQFEGNEADSSPEKSGDLEQELESVDQNTVNTMNTDDSASEFERSEELESAQKVSQVHEDCVSDAEVIAYPDDEIVSVPKSLLINAETDLVLNFGNVKNGVDQLERFKKTVVDELRAADNLRGFLQKVLDDIENLKLN